MKSPMKENQNCEVSHKFNIVQQGVKREENKSNVPGHVRSFNCILFFAECDFIMQP